MATRHMARIAAQRALLVQAGPAWLPAATATLPSQQRSLWNSGVSQQQAGSGWRGWAAAGALLGGAAAVGLALPVGSADARASTKQAAAADAAK